MPVRQLESPGSRNAQFLRRPARISLAGHLAARLARQVQPQAGMSAQPRSWIVPRWAKLALLAYAVAGTAALISTVVAHHRAGRLERARRALHADEMPLAPPAAFALPARRGGTLDL